MRRRTEPARDTDGGQSWSHRLRGPAPASVDQSQPLRAPKTREEVVDSDWHRDLQTPKLGPGDQAFDFVLPILDAQKGLTEQTVHLADYAGRQPVALIFGSYT